MADWRLMRGACVVCSPRHCLPQKILNATLRLGPRNHTRARHPTPQHTHTHTHTHTHITDLKLGKFTIKLNHRRLLDAMLAIAGVPPQKFRPICRCEGWGGWSGRGLGCQDRGSAGAQQAGLVKGTPCLCGLHWCAG
jgi:hypothetical protein